MTSDNNKRKCIEKILIVNRGEIVRRIARTAKRLEINTVSVYSDIDEKSLYCESTDESFHLGGKLSNETYLNFDKILNAVRQTGSDAVHPGFGFVSENAKFVDFMHENGVRFLGPSAESIRLMGDKIESKVCAKKAGVNVIPGLIEPIDDMTLALRVANDIGYPVILKAAAGGGGKGIRIVWQDKELEQNFYLVQREAQSSFNDDRIFIEKYIDNPRHIEIQILGDKHGNVVHLGERECTIQRRHQKVIEEAPSPFFENIGQEGVRIRNEMGRQSVLLAKEIGYYSVGTVEFVVDVDGNFYFLEVNTRLQVEHCVTEEAIRIKNQKGLPKKLDLVEWMIKIEEGDKLTFNQDDVYFEGVSIETRIYAEDPESNFMPSSGKIVHYKQPEMENLRVETGVEKGSVISVYYDPMLSKICVWGKNRLQATDYLKVALSQLVIYGENLKTNINFLEQFIRLPEFVSAEFSTNFIKQKYSDGFSSNPSLGQTELLECFIIASVILSMQNQKFLSISGYLDGKHKINILSSIDNYHQNTVVSFEKDFEIFTNLILNDKYIEGNYKFIANDNSLMTIAKIDRKNKVQKLYYFKCQYNDIYFTLENSGHRVKFRVYPDGYEKFFDGVRKNFNSDILSEKFILSPLPGRIVSICVKNGEKVIANTNLLTIEAMKMQNVIYSNKSGIVKSVFVAEGVTVQTNEKLIEFE